MDTYSDLKTRIQDELARTDLGTSVQGWVRTAELAIQNGLRVREMEGVADPLTPSGGIITVPSDWLAPGELRLSDKLRIKLTWAPSDKLFNFDEAAFAQGYGYWSVIGSQLYVRPKPEDSQPYWLKYFQKPAALTATTQETNSIFPAYGDVYLNGALWQGFSHIRNMAMAAHYRSQMIATIEQYNTQHQTEQQGTGALELCAPMVA